MLYERLGMPVAGPLQLEGMGYTERPPEKQAFRGRPGPKIAGGNHR